MKMRIKPLKVIVILAGLALLWLLFFGVKHFLPFNISQDYLKVHGVENIIFEHNWKHQCYKRCFWGLKKTEYPQVADSDILCESDDSMNKLSDLLDTDNEIHQSVYSSDEKYILYCEIEYNYMKSGMTDDEYCYYRVYDIETDQIITIYQGYREWYDLLWLD